MAKKKNLIKISPRKNSEHLIIDKDALKRICLAQIEDFSKPGFFENFPNPQITKTIYGILIYFDMNSDILGIAHLDTHGDKFTHFEQIGNRVYNASLDDRIGAYIITELLNQEKYPHDILLTVGEEMGQSTGQFFTSDKQYNWMFEFDRGGTDAVMYDFENTEMTDLIKDYGWHIGMGSFTDIVFLDHLNCKGFNFAAGFYDYHGEYAFIDIIDTENSVRKFSAFYLDNKSVYMKHEMINNSYRYGYFDNNYTSKDLWDLVTCVTCHKSFSVHSVETSSMYNVDDILAYGTCTLCTEDDDMLLESPPRSDFICTACRNSGLCTLCEGTGECATGKKSKNHKCDFCNNGICLLCNGFGDCDKCSLNNK